MEGRFWSSTGRYRMGLRAVCRRNAKRVNINAKDESAWKHILVISSIAELQSCKTLALAFSRPRSDPWFIDIKVGGASMLLTWDLGSPSPATPGLSIDCGMGWDAGR